jgi:hypothetical protein
MTIAAAATARRVAHGWCDRNPNFRSNEPPTLRNKYRNTTTPTTAKKSFSTAAAATTPATVAAGMIATNISTVTSVPACAGVTLWSATPVA